VVAANHLAALKHAFNDAVNLDPHLTATSRRVSHLLLSTYLNNGSLEAWPAATTIAHKLNVVESTVWRGIKQLCDRGYWIKVAGGGRGKSNHYRPNLERVAPTLGFDPKTLAPLQENPRTAAIETLATMREEPLDGTSLKNPPPVASRSGLEARARHGLKPETRIARQGDRDALPLESLKANTRSRAQLSNLVAERIRELAKNWDLGLSAADRACADKLLNRSDCS